MFQDTQKNAWKTLEILETDLETDEKTLWQIKNMMKLVLQHEQITGMFMNFSLYDFLFV